MRIALSWVLDKKFLSQSCFGLSLILHQGIWWTNVLSSLPHDNQTVNIDLLNALEKIVKNDPDISSHLKNVHGDVKLKEYIEQADYIFFIMDFYLALRDTKWHLIYTTLIKTWWIESHFSGDFKE